MSWGKLEPNHRKNRIMAIKLIGNYAKRLGLPGYSSHQFSVSVETELSDSGDIQGEATRIYAQLQEVVDREIQHTGFVPGDEYGLRDNGSSGHTANGNHNGQHRLNGANGHNGNGSNGHSDRWSCSDKQKELILKLVTENELDRDSVEEIALDRFGVGVRMLNKLQASGLIAELFEICGKSDSRQTNGQKGRGARR